MTIVPKKLGSEWGPDREKIFGDQKSLHAKAIILAYATREPTKAVALWKMVHPENFQRHNISERHKEEFRRQGLLENDKPTALVSDLVKRMYAATDHNGNGLISIKLKAGSNAPANDGV